MLPGGHSLKISCLRFTPENISKLSPFLAGKPFLPNNLMVVSYHFPSWQESLRHQGWWMQTCRQHRSPQPERKKRVTMIIHLCRYFVAKHTTHEIVPYHTFTSSSFPPWNWFMKGFLSCAKRDRTERNYRGISRNPANSWQLYNIMLPTTWTLQSPVACPCN